MKTTSIDYFAPIPAYLRSLTQRFDGGIECQAFVARYGAQFQPAPLPTDIRPGIKKECYRNAAQLAFSRPDLVYVEGFARWLDEPSIPFEHAWCVREDGTVIDPTWVQPSGNEYFGVPFRTVFLRSFTQKKGSWTLIDHPSMDELAALPPNQFLHPRY